MSAHEDFGLKTRFAGVIVFEELHDADFNSPSPVDVAPSRADKIKLLDEYNVIG